MYNYNLKIKNFKKTTLLHWLVVVILLLLPYFIFGGKLFIGGDDTRLYYIFPFEWLNKYATSSWMHFSFSGMENPNQFILPFVSLISLLYFFIKSKIIVTYLFFSLPLILGFIYFKKVFVEIFQDEGEDLEIEILIASLVYITSPIMIVGMYTHFLYSVWLVALVPIIQFYFIKFLKSGNYGNVFVAVLWSVVLALALFSIPWLLGYLLPLLSALFFCVFFFYKKKTVKYFFNKSVLFIIAIILGSMFWFLPFVMPLFSNGDSSLLNNVQSDQMVDTFEPTVLATSQGTITYPFLNLFHRKIAFDFNWGLKNVFLLFYDKTIFLNIIFLLIIFIGVFNYKKHLKDSEKKLYLITFVAFLISLFLFTVNIGALRQLFLLLGRLPGFVMFRNGYDKFAFGYIFLFSTFFVFNLVIFSRKFRKNKWIYNSTFLVLFCSLIINFYPIKDLLNKPLWTTVDVGTTSTIPSEYLDFAQAVKGVAEDKYNIFSIPFGISSYTIIKDDVLNSVYAGRSPVELLTGVNDFSGSMSFEAKTSGLINKYILNSDYVKLKNLFSAYNIRYILETKNLPKEVLDSYLFDKSVLVKFNEDFRKFFYGKSILKSKKGNYELYELNNIDNDSVINIPKNYFYFDDNVLDAQDSIFNLINKDNMLIENFKGGGGKNIINSINLIEKNKSVKITKGAYKMYFNNNLFVLKYDISKKLLILSNKNNASDDGWGLFELSREDNADDFVIKINDGYYKLSAIKNLLISASDKISVFKAGSVKNIQAQEILSDWGHGDCNAHDDKGAVSFHVDEIGTSSQVVLELSALNNHDACVFGNLKLEKDQLYEYSYDYKTNSKKLETYFQFYDTKRISNSVLPSSTDWLNYYTFFNSNKYDNVLVYIYSNKDVVKSTTFYKDIKVKNYLPVVDIDLLKYLNLDKDLYKMLYFNNDQNFNAISSGDVFYEYGNNSGWSEGDCAAINGEKATFFKYDNKFVELKSVNGHNACLYREFIIDKNIVYNLSFDYRLQSGNKLSTYIGFGDGVQPLVYKEEKTDNEWHHVNLNIDTPSAAKKMTAYIYSGANMNGDAIIAYKNIRIDSSPKSDYGNLLVSDNKPKIIRPNKIDVDKINNTKYRIKILGARDDFFINFYDAYHSGWMIYKDGKDNQWYTSLFEKPLNIDHYRANLYSNAWYLNVGDICNQQHVCTRNTDGSYDMEMTIEFWPQRWFYLGVIISGMTLFGSITYLIFNYRKTKWRKKL